MPQLSFAPRIVYDQNGNAITNGSYGLDLVANGPETIIDTGGAAPTTYTFNLDATGAFPSTAVAWMNASLTPAGTYYNVRVWSAPYRTGTLIYGPFTQVLGPSAPFVGILIPDAIVYPLITVTLNGVTLSGAASAGSVIVATSPTAAVWTTSTGSGSNVLQTNPAFNQAGNVGAAFNLGGGGNSYIDGSSGTGGTGGFVDFTSDASTTTGYGTWITNNAFWNGTNWIQVRGTGTSSSGFTVNNHKGFSFNRAAAIGTNNTAITWTEVANISSAGALLLPSNATLGFSSGNTGTSLPAADTTISRPAGVRINRTRRRHRCLPV